MALTVETGSIIAGAESYISAADASTYHSNRGNTSWAAATTAAQEAALRNATAYIDGTYRTRWLGFRVRPTSQPLEWPRFGVYANQGNGIAASFYEGWAYGTEYPITQIPQLLKDATCEAALRALTGSLLADMDQTVKRKKIGPLETEYFAGGITQTTTYPLIDALLSGLLLPCGQGSLVRG